MMETSLDSIKSEVYIQYDLAQSDYAKVVFCDLYTRNPDSSIGCRFQITDSVHEDPCDIIGLFQVGYENLSQIIVSKMLSETTCEENGKQMRCIFQREELPKLKDGFYQFLYVTRDNEICGASTPFEIKTKDDISYEDIIAESTEDDFLIVHSQLMDRVQELEFEIQGYKAEITQKEKEVDKLESELGICKEEIAVQEKEIFSLRDEILDLKLSYEKNVAEKANLTKAMQANMNKFSKVQVINLELEEKVKTLKVQLKAEQNKSDTLRKEIDFLVFNPNSRQMEKELLSSQEVIRKQKVRIQELLANNTSLNHKLRQKMQKNDSLAMELKLLSTERKKIEDILKDSQLAAPSGEEIKLDLQKEVENLTTMFHAVSQSKSLAMNELQERSENIAKLNEALKKTKCELYHLKEAVEDEKDLNVKLEEVLKTSRGEIYGLKLALSDEKKITLQDGSYIKDMTLEIYDLTKQKDDSLMQQQNIDTLNSELSKINQKEKEHVDTKKVEEKAENASESNKEEKTKLILQHEKEMDKLKQEFEKFKLDLNGKEENLAMQTRIAAELKSQVANLLEQKCNNDELSLKINDLELNCDQWVDEVIELRAICKDLQDKLRQQEETSKQLRDDCVKKDAIIHFLSKERDELNQIKFTLSQELLDREARIKEAEKLYKKQYKEIMYLKRRASVSTLEHLLKSKEKSEKNSNDTIEVNASNSETQDNIPSSRTSNDSDTGEHLLGNNRENEVFYQVLKSEGKKPSAENRNAIVTEVLFTNSGNLGLIKEVQSGEAAKDFIFENNQDGFAASQNTSSTRSIAGITEEEIVSIPCDVCKARVVVPCDNIGPLMEDHMEKVHNQQMCPICGRLFDKNLPSRYFQFHVEDHYNINTVAK